MSENVKEKKPIFKKWWFWTIIVIILIGIIGSTGKEENKTPILSTESEVTESKAEEIQKEKEAQIGDVISYEDSEWIVAEANNNGNTLSSSNQFIEDAHTDGKFIVIRFKVKNKTKKEEHIYNTPILMDNQNREFKEFKGTGMTSMYLPENAKTLIMEALPSGIMKEFFAIYEVPQDAKGLKFQTRSMSAFGKKKFVSLGDL